MNLLVYPWHANEHSWTDFLQRLRELLKERHIGQGDTVVEHGKIHVPGSDVRERQKGKAQLTRTHAEIKQGEIYIRRHIGMAQHDSLGSAGSSGRIDNAGEVVRLDGTSAGFEFRIAFLRGLLQDVILVPGIRGFLR